MNRWGPSLVIAVILGSVLVAATALRGADSAPKVKIETGKLEGKTDGSINAFLGIPYAAPPIGNPPAAPGGSAVVK